MRGILLLSFWKSQSSLRGGISLVECVNKFHVLEIEIKRQPMKTKFTLEEVTWCKEMEKHQEWQK